jgi:predicted O-methyltransferase YrrM
MQRSVIHALAAVLLAAAALAAASAQDPDRRSRRPAHPIVELLDADGDGTLSESEIGDAPARLKKLDTSGDGKLSGEELPAPNLPARRGVPGGQGGRGRGGVDTPESGIENPPLAKDDFEKRVLAALEESREGPRYANVSSTDGRLLRLLTEAIGAKRVVEIGTSTGESAIWFALALRRTGGKLSTHEIDPGRIRVAKDNFKAAGVDDLVTVIEGDAHETVLRHEEPIDIVFLDADKDGYIDYLRKLLPRVRPGGLIIAHNMRRPSPDPRYLEAITGNPELETAFLLMEGSGVGVTMKKR